MASGVKVNPKCLEEFQALKLGHKTKYIIYGLSEDKTEIVVLKTSTSDKYEEFLKELPADDCLWAVYDFEFSKGDDGKRSKIVFIAWSPDDARIKSKMLAASSKEPLRRSLVGVAVEVQGTDLDEITYDAVLEKCSRGY
ncbi:actin depolymerizing factor [Ceraceosorus bombacis]|uniref:Cofilin n=2 Tax=Ceraceosorus TaxID=401624 RepID=A0A0P1BHS6_9BASI|nr:hypothetical protein IE81DRAFT_319995 [Ceraceosorus guamensis]PWN45693.1 hypothetical protein IE81DRAFT_319995 [Ceraceosorus guamensis]CEH15784.1 actin depolymerizing factor [Ceraceosorus bombacis]